MAEEKYLSNYRESDVDNPTGFFAALKRVFDINEETCIPVMVVNVYTDGDYNGMVEVQPIVQNAYKTEKGITYQDRPTFAARPIRIIQGGFAVNIPIYIGDTGWVVAGDRDANEAIESNSDIRDEDMPEEDIESCIYPTSSYELKKFEFGFFISSSWNNANSIPEDIRDSFCAFAIDKKGKNLGGIRIEKDGSVVVKDKEDEARLVETELVTSFDPENNCFNTWKGKVLRTEGEEGEKIPIPDPGTTMEHESEPDSNVTFRIEDGKIYVGVYYI